MYGCCRPNDIIHIIFKESNDIEKMTVVIIESVLVLATVLIVVTYISNMYIMMPFNKMTVDNKLVLCNKENQYLLIDYVSQEKQGHTEIELVMSSLTYINGDEVVVNNTGKCYFSR